MNDNIVKRLRDQRDEDGYCITCGDGRWEFHFPKCVMCDAADEIERLRALITAWVDADALHYHYCNSDECDICFRDTTQDAQTYIEACDALLKAVGR